MSTVEQETSEQRFLMQGVSWDTYQSMLATIGDRPIRITYDRGVLELMSPSDLHERLKKLIDRILAALSEELNIPIRSQGSTTFNKESLKRGLEPDECYYIEHEKELRGRDEINLEIDPPPDLAIEIDISRSSLCRLEIYAALGIPEVWIYDGMTVKAFRLTPDVGYSEVEQGMAFPMIPLIEISRHLERRNEMDELTWIRAFRQRVRQLLEDNG